MAVIPQICDKTNEIDALICQGREREAKELAAQYLRDGIISQLFRDRVADLLNPPAKGRGRPRAFPYKWREIGLDFKDLRASGVPYESARLQIAEKYCRSESAIEKAVSFYRRAVEAANEP
jgi:hypothetical protein